MTDGFYNGKTSNVVSSPWRLSDPLCVVELGELTDDKFNACAHEWKNWYSNRPWIIRHENRKLANTAVATASWSTCEGICSYCMHGSSCLSNCRVLSKYPQRYSNVQYPQQYCVIWGLWRQSEESGCVQEILLWYTHKCDAISGNGTNRIKFFQCHCKQ